jgi:hypothetical protein
MLMYYYTISNSLDKAQVFVIIEGKSYRIREFTGSEFYVRYQASMEVLDREYL